MLRSILLTLVSIFGFSAGYAQLVINEISQGTSGNKEFVEFVVVGTKTCNDTCADIRGWIFDDNNGWHGVNGIATGCVRFANVAQWQCVPYGSLILVYNPTDKNTNILLPDDETDANGDGVYILPCSSTLFDKDNSNPSGSSSSYTASTFVNGAAAWTLLGMRNQGDAFQTVNPANLNSAYFSIGWGDVNTADDIYFAGQAGGINYYMTNSVDNNIYNQANWASGTAGTTAETPGVPNTVANAQWLQNLRTAPVTPSSDTVAVTICTGQTYFAGGANQSTTGTYRDTITTMGGCDSIVVTNLTVQPTTNQTQNLSGCGSVTVNGQTFNSNTTFRDTLHYSTGCDSVYRTFNITIINTITTNTEVCINTGQTYFAGGANQSTSGIYHDTLPASNGCDSIITTNLHVVSITNNSQNLQNCSAVTYNGTTYTSSTVVRDTLRTALGCDSVITTVNITITGGSVFTNIEACINTGQTYFAGGANQSTSGTYYDTLTAVNGCDSVIITSLHVVAITNNTLNLQDCSSITYQGNTYTSNAVVKDTLRTALGCDSVITTANIVITAGAITTNNYVCINSGQSYFAGGANQTTSGVYRDSLTSVNGCDSISVTNLQVITISTTTLNLQDCSSVTYNGNTYTSSTTIIDTLPSTLGCDSIITTVTISITPAGIVTNNPACINPGQSYFAGGATQTAAGTYYDSLISVHGCDSVVITNLQVVTPTQTSTRFDSCKQVTFNGIVYTSDVTLIDTLSSTRGCDSIYRQVSIHILPAPQITIQPSNNITITKGDSTSVTLAHDTFASISWTPLIGIHNSNTGHPVLNPDESTLYTVMVTDSNGCKANDTLRINVNLPVLPYLYAIPTAFSPNGDGRNDVFRVLLNGNAEVRELRIYNRWGEKVFESTNNDGWDGTFKDTPQPISVYVYYAIIKNLNTDKTEQVSGNLTLIR